MARAMDPRRNINDEAGYPETGELTPEMYREIYNRDPIAARVVEVLPHESWKVTPKVFETEDPLEETEFELAWEGLDETLQGMGQKSWFQDETGSPIWEYLRRVDTLSGIGGYGVLLLGVDDGKPLDKELVKKKEMKLVFLRAFDESSAKIHSYEMDKTNHRFGQPTAYNITFNSPSNENTTQGLASFTQKVHWTRVIHVTDNLDSSEVVGASRMQTVYNRLYDLTKLYAGSAEMYWRGALPGLSFETHPSLGGDVDISTPEAKEMKEQVENYMNSLQRYLVTSGIQVKSLAPQVVDPTPQINVQIEAICIRLNIPKRKFVGSERGELSSTQDEGDWNDEVRAREVFYVTPRIVVPFIDRLITFQILPEPKEGYGVKWPDLDTLSAIDQADVALKNTEALVKYIGGGVQQLIQPADYLTLMLGLLDEEAKAIIDATMKVLDEETEDESILTDPAEEAEATEALTDERQERQFQQDKDIEKIRSSRGNQK